MPLDSNTSFASDHKRFFSLDTWLSYFTNIRTVSPYFVHRINSKELSVLYLDLKYSLFLMILTYLILLRMFLKIWKFFKFQSHWWQIVYKLLLFRSKYHWLMRKKLMIDSRILREPGITRNFKMFHWLRQSFTLRPFRENSKNVFSICQILGSVWNYVNLSFALSYSTLCY